MAAKGDIAGIRVEMEKIYVQTWKRCAPIWKNSG